MVKVFIGVESCGAHRYSQQAVRDTYLKDCSVNYKFFLGMPKSGMNIPVPAEDEVIFPVHDGWFKMLHKFKLSIDWVLEHDYDYFFRCHTDTYVHVPRLLSSGFENYDFVGCRQQCTNSPPFCYGGAGFWLSRKAMLSLQATLREESWIKRAEGQSTEDYAIGEILDRNGFSVIHDDRYGGQPPVGPEPSNNFITLHESELDSPNGKEKNLRIRENMLAAHQRAYQL
jgi:hypothetical protein